MSLHGTNKAFKDRVFIKFLRIIAVLLLVGDNSGIVPKIADLGVMEFDMENGHIYTYIYVPAGCFMFMFMFTFMFMLIWGLCANARQRASGNARRDASAGGARGSSTLHNANKGLNLHINHPPHHLR